MAKALKRDDELSGDKKVKEHLLDLYKDVEKGFEDQRDRSDKILDNWDLYNCVLNEKQFYNGSSRIYAPFVHDAVVARATRWTNQIFPQSGRYIEVTTGEADPPQATTSLLEGYVRKAKLRGNIIPALIRNGDMEGQYTVYVNWTERKRRAVFNRPEPVKVMGMETEESVTSPQEEEIVDAFPDVEVIADPDLLVLPATVDSIEEALDNGGSVTVIRRWTKTRIKKAIDDEDIDEAEGKALIEAMKVRNSEEKPNVEKANADAAGIKAGSKYAQIYETWSRIKVKGKTILCRTYFGGEDRVLGCKQNPFWNDRCPVLSAPVEKVAGVFKGKAPASFVADFQYLANDTLNEGADTAHFSAMPIVMTDPLKNPRVSTMVLGLAAVWETDPQSTEIVQFPDLWRSALERAEAVKQQIMQTLGVNPSMIPSSTGGKSKRNQAEIANEQQVDLLTTADAVTNLEEGILTPMVQRFAEYDHQFRDKAITVRIYGEMGQRANMEDVEPIQLNNRFEFRWFGVESARNAAQVQQQIAGINVLKGVPKEMYPAYDLDMAPLIVQITENMFGPRLAPLIFKRKNVISVDPHQENDMLEHGFKVNVHPADDDMQHVQVHMEAMQTAGDPHGTIREHLMAHQTQMQAKAAQQQMQQPASQGQGGGPQPGAQPGQQRGMKAPPGAMHQDQMPKAGVVQMPRKM